MEKSRARSAVEERRVENLISYSLVAKTALDKSPISIKVNPELRAAWAELPGEKIGLLREAIADIVMKLKNQSE